VTKVKVAFYQKVRFVFQISKSPKKKKKIRKTILSLKFKIPAHNIILFWAGILNFKLRIVFWNIFFWWIGDLKNESHFLIKKPPLVVTLDFKLIRTWKSAEKYYKICQNNIVYTIFTTKPSYTHWIYFKNFMQIFEKICHSGSWTIFKGTLVLDSKASY
jgi:hypothetical protein